MRAIMKNNPGLLFALAALVVLAGCAAPASVKQMSLQPTKPNEYAAHRSLTQEVKVGAVTGGESTNPLWVSRIGNPQFRKALTQSLHLADLLAPSGRGQYALDAKLLKVDQPAFGFDLKVTTTIAYTLKRISDGTVVFKKVVTASYTATTSDAFAAVTRMRIANEGSARRNITKIVNALYALDIKVAKVSVK